MAGQPENGRPKSANNVRRRWWEEKEERTESGWEAWLAGKYIEKLAELQVASPLSSHVSATPCPVTDLGYASRSLSMHSCQGRLRLIRCSSSATGGLLKLRF
eukprot:2277002-Rhodomonas_salina.1